MTMVNAWLVPLALALVGGCASAIPETIRKAPAEDVQVAAMRHAPQAFRSATARWGGAIVAVHNRKEETLIEIVSRRLDDQGRPRIEDKSEGRFLAKVAGFLDPAVYAAGREVTVSGRIEGAVEQAIGEFPYLYPVLRAEQLYLWESRPLPRYRDYDPFWRDPWYPWGGPFWPYRQRFPY